MVCIACKLLEPSGGYGVWIRGQLGNHAGGSETYNDVRMGWALIELAASGKIASGQGLFSSASRAATGSTGGKTLYHYSSEAGRSGILRSGEMWASQGAKNARHGAGQYFTDIAPEAIGGRTLATTPPGLLSLGQLSFRLFRVPWNTRKLSSFLEISVDGLQVQRVAPNIYLIRNTGPLSVTGRVVRSGPTLP